MGSEHVINGRTCRNCLIQFSCINLKVKETQFKLTSGQKGHSSAHVTDICRGRFQVWQDQAIQTKLLGICYHHSALLFCVYLCSLMLQVSFFMLPGKMVLVPFPAHGQFEQKVEGFSLSAQHQEMITSCTANRYWVFILCSWLHTHSCIKSHNSMRWPLLLSLLRKLRL